MINDMPAEVLDMQVGKFLDASETDPEMARLANLAFDFTDNYNIVSNPAHQEEENGLEADSSEI